MKSSNNFTKFIFSSTLNVRILFIFLFGIFGLIIAFISFFVSSYYENKSINEELYSSAQSSFELKISALTNHMKLYENILYSFNDSNLFHQYVKTKQNKKEIQEIFKNSMIAIDELMQIRYIDKDGFENIRLDKNNIGLKPYLIPENKLQNKADRYYFQETKNTNKNQIWKSKIDLNMENDKITYPLTPTLRLTIPIYTNHTFDGIIILNISAKNLLEEVAKSALFKVSIIDKDGNFIHYQKVSKGNIANYSWSQYLKKDTSLQKEFPKIFKQILTNKQFSMDGIFSYNISDNFYNPDGLILLYEFDQNKIEQMKKEQSNYIITVALIIFIISIPIAFLMAIAPIKLSNELMKTQEELSRESKIIDKYVAFSTTNIDSEIINISTAFCELTGYSKEELLGKKHNMLAGKNTTEETYQEMYESLEINGNWSGELQNLDKEGYEYWIKLNITTIKDNKNKIIGYHSYVQNITSNKLLHTIAITDALTNLYNRRYFDEIFEQQIKIAARDKKLLAFTIMDIDHFKQYNDTYGHQEGDTVLKKVSHSLTKSLHRSGDYIFRLGGEEFGMLYTIENKDDAFTIADTTRKNIEALKIEHSGNSASQYITISMGVFIIHFDDTNEAQEIYKLTDNKLYEAKENGRNKVVV